MACDAMCTGEFASFEGRRAAQSQQGLRKSETSREQNANRIGERAAVATDLLSRDGDHLPSCSPHLVLLASSDSWLLYRLGLVIILAVTVALSACIDTCIDGNG